MCYINRPGSLESKSNFVSSVFQSDFTKARIRKNFAKICFVSALHISMLNYSTQKWFMVARVANRPVFQRTVLYLTPPVLVLY